MKKFQIKSLILGLLLGIIGTSIVLGFPKTSTISSLEKIESATFSNSKVYFYGKEISLENPLIAIRKDGRSETQLYMPMKELLEYMQFNVEWNREDSSINLTMNTCNDYDNHNNTTIPSTIPQNEADIQALDIIQKTGNWPYIEPYLPLMSTDAIKKVVEIYNSKHIDSSEHKKASDYIGVSSN
ncbi:hypothetical protein [Anaerophilus nitritogenes]|uniref:hypothetical protein n=1 Tax=Anaerophilus nitritogenes TaxID=2498136 RepID=UPI00101C2F4F|nr:hypothetical protein [Anaerophilus nitritogenes]